MSTSCQKALKLTVNSVPIGPDAYWTLDEAAGNRVDKVHAINLTPGGGGLITAQPALFSNGLGFAEKGAGVSNLATPVTANLRIQTNNGWSWCFWFKVQDWAPPVPAPWNQSPTLLWAGGATFAITVIWDPVDTALFCQDGSVPNSVGFQFSDNNLNLYCGVPLVVAIGAWNFAHVFYDPVAAQCGYQINNGVRINAPQGSGPPSAPLFAGPSANANLIFSQNWRLADTTNIPVIVDEMLFKLSRVLTPTEVAFLYNGGAGRTWPIA